MDCRSCPRLAGFLDQVRDEHPDYYALPVSSFGGVGSRYNTQTKRLTVAMFKAVINDIAKHIVGAGHARD